MFGSAGRLETLDIRNFNLDSVTASNLAGFFQNIRYVIADPNREKAKVYIGSQKVIDKLKSTNSFWDNVEIILVNEAEETK